MKVRRSSRLEHWRFPTGSAKSSSRVSNDSRSLFGRWSRWRRWSAANSMFTLIARAAQLSVQDVAVSIEELVRRRILHVIDDCFEFTHAWIREVIYASLLPSRCQLLHGQIALAYEQTGTRNDERLLSTLVHHYSRAKIWNKAAAYARQAGEHALLRCAYAEAAALFENARVALERLPRDADVLRETIDVRVRLHRSLIPTGIAAPTIENLREAETLLERVDDPARRAEVLLCVSEYARWTGHYERAVDSGYRALNAAAACGDSNLVALARFHLGQAEFWKGRYRTAISILRQSVVDADWSTEPSRSTVIFPAIASRDYLALALASIGQFDEARNAATEAMKIAEEIDDLFQPVGSSSRAWARFGRARRFRQRCSVARAGVAGLRTMALRSSLRAPCRRSRLRLRA